MTIEIEMAKQCGLAYYLTPAGTTEMHGTDRQVQAFADAVRAAERERWEPTDAQIEAAWRAWPKTSITSTRRAIDYFRAVMRSRA